MSHFDAAEPVEWAFAVCLPLPVFILPRNNELRAKKMAVLELVAS
jgi:hypothetical protein